MQGSSPQEYEWSTSTTPILDLHTALGTDPETNIAVSYLGTDGIWNTRHLKLKHADAFARNLPAGNNVYVMVNETDNPLPGMGGRGDATKITRLKAVWADLDFKESGLKDAAAAKEVISLLSGMLNADPVAIVFSGYGLQPYWEIEDGTITPANRVYMMGLVRRWGQLVQRVASLSGGHVDAVYDLPRVLRAPGTTNWKNPDSPIKTQLSMAPWGTPISVELLEETLHSYGFEHEDNPVDEFIVLSPPDQWQPAEHDCQWAASLVNEITQSNPAARHPWLVAKAIKIEAGARNGCITAESYRELVKLLDAKFTDLIARGQKRVPAHNEVPTAFTWARARVSTMDDTKLANEIGYHTHRLGELRAVGDLPKGSANAASTTTDKPDFGSTTSQGNLALSPSTGQVPIAIGQEAFAFTDSANAARLARRVVDSYIFVPSIGWHVWDGGRFVPDESKSIWRRAIESAISIAEDEPSSQGLKWAALSQMAGAIAATVRIAETDPALVCMARDLDNEPYKLCTPGGIVNIRTGELTEASPLTDRNTRQTTVTPQFTPTPEWDALLAKVIVDQERIDYLQEIFGLTLIGEVLHHVLPMFIGIGANGKSTILEILSRILGDYVATMPENFLLERSQQEHSTELARLRGVRAALGSETRPDGKFNEARVKMLTGGDRMTAREMGKNFFDFTPSHTLIIALNHPPRVSSGGESFWRRMRKFDFNVVIPPSDQDANLATRIAVNEGPGVLYWMLEGARRLLDRGRLLEPESVLAATQQYRSEEDHLQQFIAARVYVAADARIAATEIWNNYKGWSASNGENTMAKTVLLREMAQRLPMIKDTSHRGLTFKGIGLYEDD